MPGSSGYPELIQIRSPQGVRFHHPGATLGADAKAGQCSMGKQQQRGGAKQFMQGPPSDSEEEEEEVKGKSRQVNAQSRNAGEMPPNSSDEEEEEEAPKKGKAVTKQSGNAGMMPPGSSDEESDDEPKIGASGRHTPGPARCAGGADAQGARAAGGAGAGGAGPRDDRQGHGPPRHHQEATRGPGGGAD
eukprot:scaffold19853_cov56-Phaeocystis_antarctica.AAC.2